MSTQNKISVALFAPAEDANRIQQLFNGLFPGKYAFVFSFTDLSDRNARQSVIESPIPLVIVHQGVDNFTTKGLHFLTTQQGATPRVVAGIVTTQGDVYDVALEYDVIPFRLPLRRSIIEDIDSGFPDYLAESVKRFSDREALPEVLEVPDPSMPVLMSSPGNIRQALQVLTYWSSKGGVGKSTVALEMARVFAEISGRRVLFVDADSSRGYIAPRLGKDAEVMVNKNRNIVNCAQNFLMNGNKLKDVESFLYKCPPLVNGNTECNLHILLGMRSVGQSTMECFSGNNGQQGVEFIYALTRYAQNMGYEFLLFDVGPSITSPLHRAAIEATSTLYVVTTPLYPDLQPTVDGIEQMVAKNIKPRSQMRLVVNEWVEFELKEDQVFSRDTLADFTGLTIIGTLPSVHRKYIYPMVNRGEIFVDSFVNRKEPPEALNELMRGYLDLAEQFSKGTRQAARAKFTNFAKALKGGSEGIHGEQKKKGGLFGLGRGKNA